MVCIGAPAAETPHSGGLENTWSKSRAQEMTRSSIINLFPYCKSKTKEVFLCRVRKNRIIWRGKGKGQETVPVHLKMTLTIKEAAAYSNIGINRLDALLGHRTVLCPVCGDQEVGKAQRSSRSSSAKP